MPKPILPGSRSRYLVAFFLYWREKGVLRESTRASRQNATSERRKTRRHEKVPRNIPHLFSPISSAILAIGQQPALLGDPPTVTPLIEILSYNSIAFSRKAFHGSI